MAGTVLTGISNALFNLILTIIKLGRYYYFPSHFADEDLGVQ